MLGEKTQIAFQGFNVYRIGTVGMPCENKGNVHHVCPGDTGNVFQKRYGCEFVQRKREILVHEPKGFAAHLTANPQNTEVQSFVLGVAYGICGVVKMDPMIRDAGLIIGFAPQCLV